MDENRNERTRNIILAITLASTIPIALFVGYIFKDPEYDKVLDECYKLYDIKEIYNNLSLKQKNYMYTNCTYLN